MYITKLDGSPYKSEAAALAAGRVANRTRRALEKEEYKVIKKEGGYVIEVVDDLDISPCQKPDEKPIEKPIEKQVEKVPEETVEFSGDFRPMRLLSIIDKYRLPDRRYRWCNTKTEGNIEKKRAEGWVIDHDISKKRHTMPSEFIDNTQSQDTTTRLRELVLMWMPESLAVKRNKYYRDQANTRIARDQEQLRAELRKGGGSMVGSYSESRY